MSTANDDQFIQVTVNMDKLKKVFHQQSIPIFIGIVASFVFFVLFVGGAFVYKKYITTFGILALGAAVLFVDFILIYIDTVKRKNDIENRLQTARTNLYASASRLDCPMYFKHTYDATTGKNICKNEYNIGTAEFDKVSNRWSNVSTYLSSIPTFSTDQLYPYELAFANLAYTTTSNVV